MTDRMKYAYDGIYRRASSALEPIPGDDPTQPECVFHGCPRPSQPGDEEACLFHLDPLAGARAYPKKRDL